MVLLITAVLLGLGFAVFATQNTTGVTLQAGRYGLTNVPVYLVIFVSLISGLLLAWLLSAIGWVSTTLTMRGKNAQIRHSEKETHELREKLQRLEAENSRLRSEHGTINRHADEDSEYPENRKSLLDRLRLRHSGNV